MSPDVAPPGLLTLEAARSSPCMSCASSPCCTHVPLHTFQIRTLRDLDHAIYLLNFEHILLGLSPSGDWSVYYRYPCRFLDRSDPHNALCTIHGTPLQPRICVNYNPFGCWYKRALTTGMGQDFVVIDRARLERILPHLRFDEQRTLVHTPDWATLLSEWSAVPLAPLAEPDAPPPDPIFDRWLADSASGLVPPPGRQRGYGDFASPCDGCGAYCCTTLLFPHGRPGARRNLDYLQFLLGFPGIEIGVSDGDWVIAVRTRCRHLTSDNRCGVYGQPERPGICRYFDATGCSYLAQFGTPRPRGFLRLRLEQFFWMTETLRFHEDGTLVELPPTEQLREAVEARWRAALQSAATSQTQASAAASRPG